MDASGESAASLDVPHQLRATYFSLDEARKAVEALERSGVDAADIDLAGDGAVAARKPTTTSDQNAEDRAVMGHVGRRALLGLLIGMAFGAALGVIIGVASDIPEVAVVIGGAVVFGAVGFLWSLYSGISVSEAWSDTFSAAEVPGDLTTIVLVHCEGDARDLVEVLRKTDPVAIGVD